MEKVKINNLLFEIKEIYEHSPLLEIVFNSFVDLTDFDLSSIQVLTEGGVKCREFNAYNTIYKTIDENNKVILSNDESIYVEPQIVITEPYIPTEEEINLQETKSQIVNLKAQIENTDYKIIKCSEYQLMGLKMPYDITVLHNDRQTLRDQINTLETTLA